MVRRFFFLVLAAALVPLPLRPQEPEKKPDAFQYFFGKKREEKKEEPAKEDTPAPTEKPAEPAPAPAPTPEPAPVAPTPKPAPPVAEAPKPEEPKADAFQYFFGRTTQPAEVKTEEKKAPEKKPVDGFE